MSSAVLDKDTYREIIRTYFAAFGTGDFSDVRFSPDVEFLTPLSETTKKGRDEVVAFLEPVCSRVSAVEVISIAVDVPTASGVWQMTTTKDVRYTLHNFFRLDGDGLRYIWPMFDPKAVLKDPAGLVAWLSGIGYDDAG